jgi:hypothetical protein
MLGEEARRRAGVGLDPQPSARKSSSSRRVNLWQQPHDSCPSDIVICPTHCAGAPVDAQCHPATYFAGYCDKVQKFRRDALLARDNVHACNAL